MNTIKMKCSCGAEFELNGETTELSWQLIEWVYEYKDHIKYPASIEREDYV